MTTGEMRDVVVECVLSALFLGFAAYYLGICEIDCSFWNIDLNLRYNEVRAVLRGCDPYLVWKGLLPAEGCTPFYFSLIDQWPNLQFIHVYPPWSYVPMMPFALTTYERAAQLYRLVQVVLLSGLLAGMFARLGHLCHLSRRPWILAFAFALLACGTWFGVADCLVVGNFGIIVAFAVFTALRLEERGHSLWAGVFWALAAIKPQLAALVFLTLLMERRWRSLLVACSIVIVEGLVVAALCDRSLLTMVLSIRDYNIGMFHVAGLLPGVVQDALREFCNEEGVLAINSLVGLGLCVLGWFVSRRARSLSLRFLPALILSVGWSAYRLHDYSLQLVLLFIVLMVLATSRQLRQILLAAMLGMLCPLRIMLYLDESISMLNLTAFVLALWLVWECRAWDYSESR